MIRSFFRKIYSLAFVVVCFLFSNFVNANPISCTFPLSVSKNLEELKERFVCRDYPNIISATADLALFSEDQLFEVIELRAAALTNQRQFARAYLFTQESLKQRVLSKSEATRLNLISNNILRLIGSLDEDDVFAKVLENPSVLELNFRLALAQQANKNWKGLSATLRRVLMMDPENVLARTLLVRTNIRKGNLVEAEKELELIVADERINDEERDAANKILNQIKDARSPHKTTGFVSIGIGETFNPLGVSESGKAVFTAFPGQLLDFGQSSTTESFKQAIAGVSHEYSMPYQQSEAVKIDGMVFDRNYDDLNSIDLRVYSLGGSYHWKDLGHHLKLTANHVFLAKDELMSSLALLGNYRHLKTELTEINLSMGLARNLFWDRSDSTNNQDNTGHVYTIGANGTYKPFSNDLLLKAGAKYSVNDLATEALSKKVFAVDLGGLYPFKENLIGNAGVVLTKTNHDGPDDSVSLNARKDSSLLASLGLTVKLGDDKSDVGNIPALTLSYSKTVTDSNILNYDKTSKEWGLNLLWVFE